MLNPGIREGPLRDVNNVKLEQIINMKRALKYSIQALIIFGISISGFSQSAQDALRYSLIHTGGTARYVGLGGAFGALGADFTTASVNPAGIGLYQTSEVVITPALMFNNTESLYNGYFSTENKTNFYLGNVGAIFTSPLKSKSPQKGWRRVHFAMGLNRIRDYNSRLYMQGPNTENSLLDTYVETAEGPPQIPIESIENNQSYAFDLALAWYTWLLDYYGDSTNYNYFHPVYNYGELQSKYVETSGSMNEFVMTFGGNYSDKLYLGLTIGIPYFRYKETSSYIEFDHMDTIYEFRSFERYEYLESKGTGINLKFGAIYRASKAVRFGLAIHTPSWFFNMKDYWWASMQANYDFEVDGSTYYYEVSPNGNFDYKLTTPFRAIGSIAYIVGQSGLFSLDYEFVDYSMAKLSSNTYRFTDENNDIKSAYGISHNIRFGTEWKFDLFSVRAGVDLMTSPYEKDINLGDRKSFSVGAGYRTDIFFMDFAFRYGVTKSDYYFYSSQTTQPNPSENTTKAYDILVTTGFKF